MVYRLSEYNSQGTTTPFVHLLFIILFMYYALVGSLELKSKRILPPVQQSHTSSHAPLAAAALLCCSSARLCFLTYSSTISSSVFDLLRPWSCSFLESSMTF